MFPSYNFSYLKQLKCVILIFFIIQKKIKKSALCTVRKVRSCKKIKVN